MNYLCVSFLCEVVYYQQILLVNIPFNFCQLFARQRPEAGQHTAGCGGSL